MHPAALVVGGIVLAAAVYWSAKRDEALSRADAARRVTLATAPRPTTTSQEPRPGDLAFSTRAALQGLYGSYDPNLDGVFWTVSGAPREWSDWNGKPVFVKPLVARSDESGTRHLLVTNSSEIRDGLVMKHGAPCPGCKSLLGAALYERQGEQWVLSSELRFMRVEGGFGAPPRVSVDFPRNGGAEVRIESASATGSSHKPAQVVILRGRTAAPTALASSPGEKSKAPERQAAAGEKPPVDPNPTVRTLLSAALEGDFARVESIASTIKRRQPARGDRAVARTLNDRGLGLMRDQRYAVAASLFRQAHEADPADPEIRENLGYALLKAGKVTEAETALLAALETGPERPGAWGSLGYVYAKQGKREQAVALLRVAHRVAPNPKQVLDNYTRQAETEDDPKVRAMLAEAVTRLSAAR
jgi:Flp pilus assembly protein TadD